jgi:hypothetical protein
MQFLFVTVIPKYLKFTDFEKHINYHCITVVLFILVKRYVGAVSFLCSVLDQYLFLFFLIYDRITCLCIGSHYNFCMSDTGVKQYCLIGPSG